MDYKLLLYDFGGMDRNHRPFRELSPQDGNALVAVSFSNTGDRLLVATGSSQARVYDRDGHPQLLMVKGDPYIADMTNTKGHTMAVTAAQWHPQEKDLVMTASLDGTVRLWDLNSPRTFNDQLTCKRVIKARSQRNTAVPVTCAQLSPAGDWVAAGAQDGSVQCFSLRKTSWYKPDVLIRPAHGPDAKVTAVAWAPDGKTLASRGTDGQIKLWDTRKPGGGPAPLRVLPDIATHYDSANLAFSPDGRLLCAGTNVPPGEGTGTLKFWDVSNSSNSSSSSSNGKGKGTGAAAAVAGVPVLTLAVAPQASVTHVLWHRRLKQLVCGTSAGATKVLYDPTFSVKGALMSANRVKRASDPMDAGGMLSGEAAGGAGGVPVVGKIINPGSLPMYREEAWGPGKRKRMDRLDPVKSRRPELPVNGPGAQGRLGDKGSFTQFVMQHKAKNTMLEEDPREAILKYADKAKEGVQLVGRAYAKTAPVTPFQQKTLEQEVEDQKEFEQEILKK
jgi:WD repeat-containing protein 70